LTAPKIKTLDLYLTYRLITKGMNILLTDDHPIYRKGLIEIIQNKYPDFVILEAEDGEMAQNIIKEKDIDIAILDIEMPKIDGIKVCQFIKANNIKTKVIFLTMFKNLDIFNMVQKERFVGYVLKDNSVNELLGCIDYVMNGGKYISSNIMNQLNENENNSFDVTEIENGLNSLTESEKKVLHLVNENNTSKEIAEKLFLTTKSVENYRSRICKKLNLENGNNSLIKFTLDYKELLKFYL
jgi:DNA-binding NarL/FixJ family response regulator